MLWDVSPTGVPQGHHLNQWMAKFETDWSPSLQWIIFKNWCESSSPQWDNKVFSFFVLQYNKQRKEAFIKTSTLFCLVLMVWLTGGIKKQNKKTTTLSGRIKLSSWSYKEPEPARKSNLSRPAWLTKRSETRGLKSPPVPVTSSLVSGSLWLVPWELVCCLLSVFCMELLSAVGL